MRFAVHSTTLSGIEQYHEYDTVTHQIYATNKRIPVFLDQDPRCQNLLSSQCKRHIRILIGNADTKFCANDCIHDNENCRYTLFVSDIDENWNAFINTVIDIQQTCQNSDITLCLHSGIILPKHFLRLKNLGIKLQLIVKNDLQIIQDNLTLIKHYLKNDVNKLLVSVVYNDASSFDIAQQIYQTLQERVSINICVERNFYDVSEVDIKRELVFVNSLYQNSAIKCEQLHEDVDIMVQQMVYHNHVCHNIDCKFVSFFTPTDLCESEALQIPAIHAYYNSVLSLAWKNIFNSYITKVYCIN